MAVDRKTQREFIVGVCAVVVLSAFCMVLLANSRAGAWLESGTLDARARFAANPAQADRQIVIIDADNASLSSLQEKLGRWPWTRRVWTEIVRYVDRGQPKAIAIDAIFSGAESPAVDAGFATVLKSQRNAVLGFTFVATQIDHVDQADQAGAPRPPDQPLALAAAPTGPGGPATPLDLNKFVPNLPEPQLSAAAAALGALNAQPDPDGVIRRVPLQFRYGSRIFNSFDTAAAQQALAQPLQWSQHRNAALLAGRSIPVDPEGRILLLWHGGSFVYPRLPLWEVICSIYPDQCPADVERFPPEYFRDKIVLIGTSAAASYDAHPTPFATAAPGFLAHATAIDNLLHGEAIRQASLAWFALASTLMAAIGGYASFFLRRLSQGTLLVLLLLAAYAAACFAAYAHWHFAAPMVTPMLALFLSFGLSTGARYVTTGRQLRQTRGMLDRYMAPQLVEYVMSNIDDLRLAGDKRELTILVSDVRNFTTMTERSDPLQLIALLDDYFAAMTEIIFRHNGIVDKFIGDGILAYWGAFTPSVNHAAQAAEAALEMLTRVEQLNLEWAPQDKGPISIGIGINTGPVIFGNIGRGKKIEFTVIGDAVNLASRLEGLNKEFQTSIIISDCTRERIAAQASTRSLGGYKVKGKTVETTVHELLGWTAREPAAPVQKAR
jgi:adenylate cyclase